MSRIGANLLKQSKASQDDKSSKSPNRRDLLSLLIQANTMQDLPESQRMSDGDVMARTYELTLDWCIYSIYSAEIPTFLLTGHETTRYTHPSLIYFAIETDGNKTLTIVSQCHGHCML